MRLKALMLLFVAGLFLNPAGAYESERGGTAPPPDTGVMCWNGVDDDTDSETPPDAPSDLGPYEVEPGCVNPYFKDDNEGMSFASHFLEAMEGSDFDPGSETDIRSAESLLFKNEMIVGPPENPTEKFTPSSDIIKSYRYLEDQHKEASDKYGFGVVRSTTVSETDYEQHSAGGQTQRPKIVDGRVIDTPHSRGGLPACGNAVQENYYSEPTQIMDQESSNSVDCLADYGKVRETDVSGSRDSYSDTGTQVSASCGCDLDDDSETKYYVGSSKGSGGDANWDEEDGDKIYSFQEVCEYEDTCGCCDDDCEGSCYSEYDEGDDYDVVEDCSERSKVYGGGTTDTGVGENTEDLRMGNNPAATYTEMTGWATSKTGGSAYCGYEWATTIDADGPDGGGTGMVVINEEVGDGTNDLDRVMGRNSILGTKEVGRNIYMGHRDHGESNPDITKQNIDLLSTNKVDLSCPGDKTKCIKYIDPYVETSGWTTSDGGPSESEILEAVKVQTQTYKLSESYSVCQAANRITRDYTEDGTYADSIDFSNGERLVNCNYMRGDPDGDTGRAASPLEEACGDEPKEALITMEGPSIDYDGDGREWLGLTQKCVDWADNSDGDTGEFGRELSSDACVANNKAYSEGSVARIDPVETSTTLEENGEGSGTDQAFASPDKHVCLDLQQGFDGEDNDAYVDDQTSWKAFNYNYSDKDEPMYFGGQWYDLDDERVNEFLQDVEDGDVETVSGHENAELPKSIDSGEFGQSGQETNYIDYYYGFNPNPFHPSYNPRGAKNPGEVGDENRGTSLVADCGPAVEACASDYTTTRGKISSKKFEENQASYEVMGRDNNGTYFSLGNGEGTFRDNALDAAPGDDKSGGEGSSGLSTKFEESTNKVKSASGQLVKSHYDWPLNSVGSEPSGDIPGSHLWWHSTYVNESTAAQFAMTKYRDWVPDSNGVPYPPAGTPPDHDDQGASGEYIPPNEAEAGVYHYVDDSKDEMRTNTLQDTVTKTTHAHGNSVVLVADQRIDKGSLEPYTLKPLNSDVAKGEGFWADPDDVRELVEAGYVDTRYVS